WTAAPLFNRKPQASAFGTAVGGVAGGRRAPREARSAMPQPAFAGASLRSAASHPDALACGLRLNDCSLDYGQTSEIAVRYDTRTLGAGCRRGPYGGNCRAPRNAL